MYISAFTPLITALSGVEASQDELDTTGENISNENTPGYVEQQVNLTEAPAVTFTDGAAAGGVIQLGTGVQETSITNNASQYLDTALQTQNAATGSASTVQNYVNQLQAAVGEPSDQAISGQLSTFWKAWNSLADTPTSTAAQQVVYDDGQQLANSLNSLSQQFQSISAQATNQFNTLTGSGGEVQTDASEIAQLNGAIKSATLAGANADTLIDQRNQALTDLSSLAHITVTNNSDGTITVDFGDAASPLVSGTSVNWPQSITSASGGELGALLSLTAAGGTIAQYSAGLDGFASALASEVNGVTGLTTPFFSGNTAGTIAVAVTPSQISATSNPVTDPGGNDVANAEADLSGGNADQVYDSFVAQLGDGAEGAQNNLTTQTALQTAIKNQQQSIEGVDISQETTNMVEEQQAYQACAQVMSTFSAMMDSLMSAVGA